MRVINRSGGGAGVRNVEFSGYGRMYGISSKAGREMDGPALSGRGGIGGGGSIRATADGPAQGEG